MASTPTRDDYAVLIGKALTAVSFGKACTEFRFDGDLRIEIRGDIEHRVHTDMVGRAVPGKEALPSLSDLVGKAVRQVGTEQDYLLLAFDDGHEVRLFAGDRPSGGFEIVPAAPGLRG